MAPVPQRQPVAQGVPTSSSPPTATVAPTHQRISMPAPGAPVVARAVPVMPAPALAQQVQQAEVAEAPPEWESPPTEEIPTKPPVAAAKAAIKAGGPRKAAPVVAPEQEGDGAVAPPPSKLDMILAIVAALVSIGVVVVLWLKVISKLDAS